MDAAAALKAEGTALFKSKEFRRARDKYGEALSAVPALSSEGMPVSLVASHHIHRITTPQPTTSPAILHALDG